MVRLLAQTVNKQGFIIELEKREDINDFYSQTCPGICYHNIKLPSLHQFGKIALK